jgi:phosphoribosylformimino-5-aminoimidazole carboxamide ribotide isomerase
MHILPAVDIRGGKAVRLIQGDFDREIVFNDDPVATALHWIRQGAHRVHVVDLDASKEGRPVNGDIVRRIVTEAGIDVRVQVAGGVRAAADVDAWLDAGADRVVIGTLALEQPDAISAIARSHAERIAVAAEVKDGKLAARGWTETHDVALDAFLGDMVGRGVRHFLYTDISRDGMLQHLEFRSVKNVAAMLRELHPEATLTYAGGVTSVEDIVSLNEYGLEAAIIGLALYDGTLDFAQARLALETGDGTG